MFISLETLLGKWRINAYAASSYRRCRAPIQDKLYFTIVKTCRTYVVFLTSFWTPSEAGGYRIISARVSPTVYQPMMPAWWLHSFYIAFCSMIYAEHIKKTIPMFIFMVVSSTNPLVPRVTAAIDSLGLCVVRNPWREYIGKSPFNRSSTLARYALDASSSSSRSTLSSQTEGQDYKYIGVRRAPSYHLDTAYWVSKVFFPRTTFKHSILSSTGNCNHEDPLSGS